MNIPKPELIDITCDHCNEEFKKYTSAIKRTKHNFCSRKCWNGWHKGENHFRYNKEGFICKICKKESFVKPTEAKRRITCSRKCRGILISKEWRGQCAPNWRGGIYPESQKIRRRKEYKVWLNKILSSSKVCLMCRSKDKLQAHHIIKVSEDKSKIYNPSNGMVLCKWCHHMVHSPKSRPKLTTYLGEGKWI